MITNKLTELVEKLDAAITEYNEKESYRKAVVARKILQEIKMIAQEMRKEITENVKKKQ